MTTATTDKQELSPASDQQWLNPLEIFSWWALAAVGSAGMLAMLSMYAVNVDNQLDIAGTMFGTKK